MSGKRTFQQLAPFPVVRFGSAVGKAWAECWDCLRLGAQYGVPGHLIWFGLAPGDDLLCTAVLRELHKRGGEKVWMMTQNPEIFRGNADVARVVPVDDIYPQIARKWVRRYDLLTYYRHDEAGKIIPPKDHVITALCARADITGEIDLRPYMHLTDREKEAGKWAQGRIAIQSSGLDAAFPSLNKQWYPERFQAVVDKLKGAFEFVQLGSKSDPLLEGARDMRGKTSMRESGAILASCRLYIGGEGFLMHMARAVDCPSVIVYGGRVAPRQIGYACNTNLYTELPCSPCWERDKCDFNRTCMDQIEAHHVVAAAMGMLNRPRGPLSVEKATL